MSSRKGQHYPFLDKNGVHTKIEPGFNFPPSYRDVAEIDPFELFKRVSDEFHVLVGQLETARESQGRQSRTVGGDDLEG